MAACGKPEFLVLGDLAIQMLRKEPRGAAPDHVGGAPKQPVRGMSSHERRAAAARRRRLRDGPVPFRARGAASASWPVGRWSRRRTPRAASRLRRRRQRRHRGRRRRRPGSAGFGRWRADGSAAWRCMISSSSSSSSSSAPRPVEQQVLGLPRRRPPRRHGTPPPDRRRNDSSAYASDARSAA